MDGGALDGAEIEGGESVETFDVEKVTHGGGKITVMVPPRSKTRVHMPGISKGPTKLLTAKMSFASCGVVTVTTTALRWASFPKNQGRGVGGVMVAEWSFVGSKTEGATPGVKPKIVIREIF